MNGVHDMGGMQGFGPVVREPDEPVFHAEWEAHILALQRAATRLGFFNLDEFRWGIERIPAARYLQSGYYERWVETVETNLVEKGLLSPGEIAARVAELRADPDATLPRREDPALADRLATLTPPIVPPAGAARFAVGDTVRARNMQPAGHTRLPRYVRGRRGVVVASHGLYPLPDRNAHGHGPALEPLYGVRFDAAELWGESAEPGASVTIDLSESYLEPGLA